MKRNCYYLQKINNNKNIKEIEFLSPVIDCD